MLEKIWQLLGLPDDLLIYKMLLKDTGTPQA